MNPSDGKRLEDIDPEVAKLFGALRSGGPSKEALTRTLGAVESAASAAQPGATSRPVKASSVALWVGAGALALVTTVAGYEWTRDGKDVGGVSPPSSSAPAHEEPNTTEPPTSSVRVEDLPPAPAPSSEVEPPAKPLAATRSAPSAAPAAPPSTVERAPSADDFRDELALVERIRTQLSRGDTEACLRSVDQYEARFASGAFVQEVEVMRVEALATSGEGDRARTFGQRFLSEHPKSPYAGRVRSVLDKTK